MSPNFVRMEPRPSGAQKIKKKIGKMRCGGRRGAIYTGVSIAVALVVKPARFTGQWQMDLQVGFGIETWVEGAKFEG